MSWPSLHALINHFPIVLTVIGALAILLATLHERRAIWMYALSTLTLAGVTIYPATLTGQRAARAVRHAWYIAPGAINAHLSAANVTLWVVGATGLLALIALFTLARTRDATSPAKGFRVLVGLGALLSISAVAYTGYLGGKIVIESPVLESPTPPPPVIQTVPAGTTLQPAAGQPMTQPAASPGLPVPTQQPTPAPQTTVPQVTVPQTQTQTPPPKKP
jgi:uncharacterized membrane protein